MPWSDKQHRLFQAAAHNPAIARSSGIPQGQARKMAAEGVKSKGIKRGPMMAAKLRRK